MSGGGGGAIVGFWYSIAFHMGICRGPINSIVETRVGDKTAIPFELPGSGIIPVYKPDLFGGETKEGGVMGSFRTMFGEPDQVAPVELSMMAGMAMPGFRRVTSVFWDGYIAALNPYPKPWTFRVRRTDKGWDGDVWYPEKIKIVLTRPMSLAELTSSPEIHAMNPAHIVYEVLTNREWGRGLPRSALDDAQFRLAADALYDEGFGLCMRWVRTDSVETFVQSVIDHIGAVLRPNRVTGELQLKLVRNDYVIEDLPLFEAGTGLLEISEASVATMPSVVNHVTVKYRDPITSNDASISIHNLAGVQGQSGEVNTLTKDYPGLCTPELAARVAQRDLRASSSALRRFTFKLDRRGQAVQPGDAIRIRDAARSIPDTVVRVGRTENGTMLSGAITVTAVQDVFGLPASAYVASEPPRWEPPNTSPCIGYNRVFELPYFMLARRLSDADLDYLKPEAGYIGAVVELGGRPTNSGYKLAVRLSDITEDDAPAGDTNFCPTVPAEWDGGDCVRIVGGDVYEMTVTAGEFESFPGLVGYRYPSDPFPFGSISGTRSDRVIEFSTYEGSSGGAMQILGEPDDGYREVRFTVDPDGAEHVIPLTFTEDPRDGYSGYWSGAISVAEGVQLEVGDTVQIKVYGALAVVEACCVCIAINITGTPVLDPEVDAYSYTLGGTITVPGSGLALGNALYPAWGPAWTDYTTDPISFSDNTFLVTLTPWDHPWLTSVLQCKIYDDSDGGTLAYETTLYLAGNGEAAGAAVYFERPVADVLDVPWPEFPLLYSGAPPFNPATALAGHNLRMVLSTANACCGGLPPEPESLSMDVTIAEYPTYPTEARGFSAGAGWGSISGPDAARGIQMFFADVSEHFEEAQTSFGFSGTEDEGWTTMVLTYAGTPYSVSLAYSSDFGAWVGSSPALLFWPDVGSVVSVSVNNS